MNRSTTENQEKLKHPPFMFAYLSTFAGWLMLPNHPLFNDDNLIPTDTDKTWFFGW